MAIISRRFTFLYLKFSIDTLYFKTSMLEDGQISLDSWEMPASRSEEDATVMTVLSMGRRERKNSENPEKWISYHLSVSDHVSTVLC